MTRITLPIVAMLLLAGCDRPKPVPAKPDAAATDAGFDNAAAPRSIMQPKVIAESPPEATAEPASPPPPERATVLFAKGSALDDAGRTALDTLLAAPGRTADTRYVLRGSSDNDGSKAANLTTSRKRANAVRDYLVEKGIAADRITVIALGDGRPAAPNVQLDGSDDPAGRARNRRVDVEIARPPAPTPEAGPSGSTNTPDSMPTAEQNIANAPRAD
ncbi:OmpA-OmpF porin, OOP family [Sphingomonas gellani]|uniref:OmpA-OmpF porin, OOP family n=1 Tax=Sphingomonas gellani TaxID=1166340 RepID=A0A1H8EHH9_9SPHN|nr:OmpA family protein [Sphingomonas gellani]SEN18866.1 OmpA-OmpF porin, OOP family [Sphingomonas gellani]